MKQLRTVALRIFTLTLLVYASNCQDSTGRRPKDDKVLLPPKNVTISPVPFGLTLTPTTAMIQWKGPPNADNYIVVIFKAQNGLLAIHEEIKNVPDERFEFTDLDPATKYEVLIKSVRVHSDGTHDESEFSETFSFETGDACTGGRVYVQCTAHCVPTCEKPYQGCDKRCIAGCSCVGNTPYWHNGKCITAEDCKVALGPATEIIGRPTGLKIHKMKGSNDVLFTWNEVEGADFYTVIVSLKGGVIVKEYDDIKRPLLVIKDLKPKVPYRFKVQAKYIKFDDSRWLAFGVPIPDAPDVTEITDTSFHIQWKEHEDAESYKIVITDAATYEIIQIFKEINVTYVKVQGLYPATEYEVTIIVVTPSHVIESYFTLAKTLGSEVDGVDVNPTEIPYIAEETTTTTTPGPVTTKYILTCRDRRRSLEVLVKTNDQAKIDVHIPDCDSNGNYEARQCEKGKGCYCVEKRYGDKQPGSDFKSTSSKYALNCDRYGDFKTVNLDVRGKATDTSTVRVRWNRDPAATFYIVKVFNGYLGGYVMHLSGIVRNNAEIVGLERGTAYVIVVVAVNKDGWTSTDRIKGAFIATPHLDPPTNLRIEQVTPNRMKVSWTKNAIALHYQVEVYKDSEEVPDQTIANVTEDHTTFSVQGSSLYRVKVISTGVSTIPGSGIFVLVSSNAVDTWRRPSCMLPAMDIIYVIDVSNHMSEEEYDKAKEMFVMLSESLTPIVRSKNSASGTRIAGLKTYSVTREMFRFERFDNHRSLIGAIRWVRQANKGYNMKNMLQKVHSNFFAANNNDQRKNVATAVIAFIGGETVDNDFALEARQLQSETTVIAVGVKEKTMRSDIEYLAKAPNRVMVDNFDDMKYGYEKVLKILCNLK